MMKSNFRNKNHTLKGNTRILVRCDSACFYTTVNVIREQVGADSAFNAACRLILWDLEDHRHYMGTSRAVHTHEKVFNIQMDIV